MRIAGVRVFVPPLLPLHVGRNLLFFSLLLSTPLLTVDSFAEFELRKPKMQSERLFVLQKLTLIFDSTAAARGGGDRR